MTDRDDRVAADRLDRATKALRDAPVPEGPPPRLVTSTVAALRCRETSPDAGRLRQRRKLLFRVARYGAAAAGALLVALVGYFWLVDRGAALAFGDVIENVKKAESVCFVFKQKLGLPPVIVSKMYVQGEKWRLDIVEIQAAGQQGSEKLKEFPVLLSHIADFTKKEWLELDHFRKTAKRATMDDRTAAQFTNKNPVEQLRNVKQEDAEWIGQEQRNGRTLHIYRLTEIHLLGIQATADEEGDETKIWVDQQSGLPARIRIAGIVAKGPSETYFDFDEFVWNQPLDPDLFKLEIPEGYTVQEPAPGPKPAAEK